MLIFFDSSKEKVIQIYYQSFLYSFGIIDKKYRARKYHFLFNNKSLIRYLLLQSCFFL